MKAAEMRDPLCGYLHANEIKVNMHILRKFRHGVYKALHQKRLEEE